MSSARVAGHATARGNLSLVIAMRKLTPAQNERLMHDLKWIEAVDEMDEEGVPE